MLIYQIGFMKILALDLAQNIGVAVGDGTVNNTTFLSYDLTKFKTDYGHLAWVYGKILSDLVKEHEPDIIAIEDTTRIARGQNAYHLHGLPWQTHMAGYGFGIPRRSYTPTAIKKYWTGNGRATKMDMIDRATDLGFNVENDHEADALALLRLTKHKERQP